MNSGIPEHEWKEICAIFAEFPQVRAVSLFGSRAKGTQKPGSDVDLAVMGELDVQIIASLRYRLNQEGCLPYQFDLLDYAGIESADLRRHIDTFGVEVYKRHLSA